MNRIDELLKSNQALRERLSRLSEAILRINQSLDFDKVLQQVLDNARVLTGARYGAITVQEEVGQLEAFLSSGFSPEEQGALFTMPDGVTIFGYLSRLPQTLRLRDFASYIDSAGFSNYDPPVEVNTFLGTPMRHGGNWVGNFYLGEKGSGLEFTSDDEEVLEMFAAQAALVIANARRYREEQRARAGLETLINTSPVGVVVFDARSGAPRSFNREASRIMQHVRLPDHPPEKLLEVLTVRRADGREFSLRELPFAEVLSDAETVRAEELILSVPDGRSVAVLVNVTPMRSEDGDVETVVVTIQDMTPLEETERMRAEFLGMVSHELRAPLATVRGSATALLEEPSDMHPAEMRQFHRIILEQTDRMRALIADLLDVARIETGTLPVSPGPTDMAVVAGEAENAFRIGGNKQDLSIDIPPDLPWVMADKSRILQVLGNLLANAARHSPESSAIRVSAVPGDMQVYVSVSDEGRGIPAESLPHLFRKFSRLESEEQRGDTGLGLAVCKGIVEAHGGRIWARSDGAGLGAKFTFTIPTVDGAGFVSPVPAPRQVAQSARGAVREHMRILAVDDDDQALRYIRDALVKSGFTVIATGDPEDVPRLCEEEKPHLVLLDLMLPGVDGVDLMKDIMAMGDVPVIFVSAYGQDQLIARAFEMGADDYVVKPFSPTELVARIRAVLRRRTTAEPSIPYVSGDLSIDYAERLVALRGSPVDLTAIQYRSLVELSVNAGRVVTYEHLLRRVWGANEDGDLRPIRTAISTIRRKLGDDADNPTYIFTEFRVGYKMPKADSP